MRFRRLQYHIRRFTSSPALVITAEWFDPSLDESMASVLRHISGTIHAAALADGQDVSRAAKYVNYALFGNR